MRKHSKILKLFLLIGILFHFSCEKEEIYEPKAESSKDLVIKHYKLSDLKSKPIVYEKISDLAKTKPKSNYLGRIVNVNDYGFSVETDDIMYIQDGDNYSYTFKIYRDTLTSLTENLVLKPNDDGSFETYLVQYNYTEEDKENYNNGLPVANKHQKTQIQLLDSIDTNVFFRGSGNQVEGGLPPLPSGCCWELIDYEATIDYDAGTWEVIDYYQINCNCGGGGGGSGTGSGDSGNTGGWSGSGNTDGGSSPTDGSSSGTSGGGSSSGSSTSGTKPLITAPVGLDGVTIKDPCVNAVLENNKVKTIFNKPDFQAKLSQINGSIPTDAVEKGFNFGTNPSNGNFVTTDVQTGTATGLNLPVTNPNFNITGSVHTHPGLDSFDSFSIADFYGFTEANTANSNFSTVFVLGATGEIYSLTITDPSKFQNFANLFPKADHFDPATNGWKKGSPLYTSFMDALMKFRDNGKNLDEAYALANAYVLKKFNAGMSISKKNSSGDFETLFVEEKKDPNDDTKTIFEQTSTCNL